MFGKRGFDSGLSFESHGYSDEFGFIQSYVYEIGERIGESIDGRSSTSRFRKEGSDEIVTEFDRKLSQEVMDEVNQYFPDYGIVVEDAESESGEKNFIVDPIDGTMNFAEGLPEYCVSMAVEDGGETQVAAVYAPEMDKLYTAVKGEGAFLNGEEISVADERSRDGIVYAKISDRNAGVRDVEAPVVLGLKDIEGIQVRRRGSAALDGCHVAEGAGIGQFLGAINDYDVAASNLIIEEAGGKVVMREGDYPRNEDQNYPELLAAGNQENLKMLLEQRAKTEG